MYWLRFHYHDREYDPITQKEFYQLYAFLNNFDGKPETGGRSGTDSKRGLQKPYFNLPPIEQTKELAQLQSVVAALDSKIQSRQQELKAAKLKTTVKSEAKQAEGKSSE